MSERKAAESFGIPRDFFWFLLEYRVAKPVTQMRVFHTPYGQTVYYVCPRCETTLEWEFAGFCDRCGQRLDWRQYKKARAIEAGKRGK